MAHGTVTTKVLGKFGVFEIVANQKNEKKVWQDTHGCTPHISTTKV